MARFRMLYQYMLVVLMVCLATIVPHAVVSLAKSQSATISTNLIQDGGFEASNPDGSNPYWSQSSTNFSVVICNDLCNQSVKAHTGTYFAWFGGLPPQSPTETGVLSQSVMIPRGSATLNFWLKVTNDSGHPNDYLKVSIDDTSVFTATNQQNVLYADYTLISLPVSQFADGNPHILKFYSVIETGGNTNFLVDDISLEFTYHLYLPFIQR